MVAPAIQLSYEECITFLTASEIVDSMSRAFAVAHAPEVVRCQMSTLSGEDLVFGHASVLPKLGLCVKAGIQVPGNRNRGVDPVQAAVVLFDATTGEPRAVLDGRAVTTMRTAGALVAAIRAVEPPARPRVAVLGFGAQGRMVAQLATQVLDASEVRVYARSSPSVPAGYLVTTSVEAAVRDADVVACCTTATDPILTAEMVADGAVVASMGSYSPERCEIDPDIVRRSSLIAADVSASNLGPIARLLDGGEHIPQFVDLGRIPVEVPGGIRCVFVGGTGVEDACAGWSVLLGWPTVDRITGQYPGSPRSTDPSTTPEISKG